MKLLSSILIVLFILSVATSSRASNAGVYLLETSEQGAQMRDALQSKGKFAKEFARQKKSIDELLNND